MHRLMAEDAGDGLGKVAVAENRNHAKIAARRALLEAGRRLAADGRVREAEHVLEVFPDEAVPLIERRSGPGPDELADRARRRRAEAALARLIIRVLRSSRYANKMGFVVPQWVVKSRSDYAVWPAIGVDPIPLALQVARA